MRLLLSKYNLFVFDSYSCSHMQLDLCYSSAHEISTAAVPILNLYTCHVHKKIFFSTWVN